MTRIIIAIAALLGFVVIAGSGWYYRPWSEYSPAEIQRATQPEHLVETFREMGEVFPYRTIHASSDSVGLPRNVANDVVSFDLEGTVRTVPDWHADANATGLMVLHNGEVVHEENLLQSSPMTLHTSWSVGKSFVATLIAMAIEGGLIDNLDQTAETFAPQFAGTDYGATSLRHLLMMSAGVDFEEDYFAPDSDIRRLFLGANIYGRSVDRMVADVERNREPGQDLHYVSANTHVLSAVVRAIYDRPLAEIVQAKIWEPLGMTADAIWNQNIPGDNGMAIGYCCLNATLDSYARLGQLYLQDGVWNGERLLPEGWVQLATRPHAAFQEPGPDAVYDGRGYGLHFWVPEGYDGEWFMAGVYGQYVWVDERRNIVIVRTAADIDWMSRREESFAAFRALAAHYGDPIDTPIDTPIEMADGEDSTDE